IQISVDSARLAPKPASRGVYRWGVLAAQGAEAVDFSGLRAAPPGGGALPLSRPRLYTSLDESALSPLAFWSPELGLVPKSVRRSIAPAGRGSRGSGGSREQSQAQDRPQGEPSQQGGRRQVRQAGRRDGGAEPRRAAAHAQRQVGAPPDLRR